MSFLYQGLSEALAKILQFDRDLLSALLTTLRVSVSSTLLASALSLPLGFLLARDSFPGKQILLGFLRTALALPTVVVALFVYAFVTRNAPLGSFELLFTPTAIVIGQILLITPLVTALVYSALEGQVGTVHEEAILLGASPIRAFWKTVIESKAGIITALLTGFGRVVSEIGVSLVLGGNIRGLTRTMTTAIALETGQGNFAAAIALGLLLLLLVLTINLAIQLLGGEADAA